MVALADHRTTIGAGAFHILSMARCRQSPFYMLPTRCNPRLPRRGQKTDRAYIYIRQQSNGSSFQSSKCYGFSYWLILARRLGDVLDVAAFRALIGEIAIIALFVPSVASACSTKGSHISLSTARAWSWRLSQASRFALACAKDFAMHENNLPWRVR